MGWRTPILVFLLLVAGVACVGDSVPADPTPTVVIGGTDPAPPSASPGATPRSTPGTRPAGVWTGTISGQLRIVVVREYGTGTTDTSFQIDARLVERPQVLKVGSRDVAEYTMLFAEGTVVRNSSMFVGTVDGERCTGSIEARPRTDVPSGSIVRKLADADLGSLIGFDVPRGEPVYQVDFHVNERMTLRCTVGPPQDRVSIHAPTIGCPSSRRASATTRCADSRETAGL